MALDHPVGPAHDESGGENAPEDGHGVAHEYNFLRRRRMANQVPTTIQAVA